MRLLILTQKIDKNDNLLGFFHRWIEEFAKHCESVVVVCLEKGEYDLPENVRVLSLGKEEFQISNFKFQILRKTIYILRFYKYIWQERKSYDCVFVHMNREYVLLGGVLWRLWKKKIALWFVHFETPFSLRIAERLSHIIFTASKESFQLTSTRVRIVGHGIDLKRFSGNAGEKITEPIRMLYVGKITPIKNVHILIDAVKLLKDSWGKNFVITLIGPTTTKEDEKYKEALEKRIFQYNLTEHVRFLGSVPYKKIHEYYKKTNLVINLCPTGGIDKMVVEGMASGALVVVSNETFRKPFGVYAPDLLYEYQNPKDLAEKIQILFQKNEKEMDDIRIFLREKSKSHSIGNLIVKIVTVLQKA